jgi:hypothetical protein
VLVLVLELELGLVQAHLAMVTQATMEGKPSLLPLLTQSRLLPLLPPQPLHLPLLLPLLPLLLLVGQQSRRRGQAL